MLHFIGFEEDFSDLSLNGETAPHFTILNQNNDSNFKDKKSERPLSFVFKNDVPQAKKSRKNLPTLQTHSKWSCRLITNCICAQVTVDTK